MCSLEHKLTNIRYWVIHSILISLLFIQFININLGLANDIKSFQQQKPLKYSQKKRQIMQEEKKKRRFKIEYPGKFLDKKKRYSVCYYCYD